MAVSCFSGDGSMFLLVTGDNRLSVWDVATGSLRVECTPEKHLETVYTCIAWGAAKKSKRKGGAAKRKRVEEDGGSDGGPGVAVLGTSSGAVHVFDLARGELSRELATDDVLSGQAVSGVAFDANVEHVYGCCGDNQLYQWALSSGELTNRMKVGKTKVTAVASCAPARSVAVAGTGVRLLDKSGKKIWKSNTHSGSVRLLAFGDDSGRFLVSTAGDRDIYCWQQNEGTSKPSVVSIAMPAAVTGCDSVSAIEGDEATTVVVAAHNDGTASVARFNASDGSKGVERCRIHVRGRQEAKVLNISLEHKSGIPTVCTVAHASGGSPPQFARVQYVDEDDAVLDTADVMVSSSGAALFMDGETGPDVTSATGGATAITAPGTRPSRAVSSILPEEDSKGDEGGDEPTLEARVARLATAMQARGGSGELAVVDAADVPQAGTLHTALEQALQSLDDKQLEACLSISDPALIESTVARLSTSKVIPFLTRVIQKFESRPSRGTQLVPWIRAVLVQHTAYLMTVPGLVGQLSALYTTVDTRLLVFKKLLKLSGRLDLVLSQIDDHRRGRQAMKRGRSGAREVEESDTDDDDADDSEPSDDDSVASDDDALELEDL